MSLNKASKAFMLIGQCVPCLKHNASKIQIKRLELDTNLLMVNMVYSIPKIVNLNLTIMFRLIKQESH